MTLKLLAQWHKDFEHMTERFQGLEFHLRIFLVTLLRVGKFRALDW